MSDLAWMRPKLAELCGLDEFEAEVGVPCHDNLGVEHAIKWAPDEDVAQAVRCLEALNAKGYNWTMRQGEVTIQEPSYVLNWRKTLISIRYEKSLPETVCLAISAALGWKEHA